MLLVEERSVVGSLAEAGAGSLEPRTSDPWTWTHRLEFVLRDGSSVDAGLQLDGQGRFALLPPGAERTIECVLTQELRSAVRGVLIDAVERGELIPNDALPERLRP